MTECQLLNDGMPAPNAKKRPEPARNTDDQQTTGTTTHIARRRPQRAVKAAKAVKAVKADKAVKAVKAVKADVRAVDVRAVGGLNGGAAKDTNMQ